MVITLDIKGIYKHLYLPIMTRYCSIGKCFRRQSSYLYLFSKGKYPALIIGQCFKNSMVEKNKNKF